MVMEYVRRAWEAYKKNWMTFIVAELLILIIIGIIFGIGIGIIFGSLGISSLMELTNIEFLAQRIVAILPLLAGFGSALIFFIIAGLVGVFLNTGIYGMAAEALRGRTKVDTMFKVAKKMGITGVLTSIILGIISFFLLTILVAGLGITLPIVGSVIGMIIFLLIMMLFSLVFPGIVVDNLGTIETIQKSFNIVKKNYFEMFGLLLFYAIVSIVLMLILTIIGMLICWFVVAPMLYISLVFFYRRKK